MMMKNIPGNIIVPTIKLNLQKFIWEKILNKRKPTEYPKLTQLGVHYFARFVGASTMGMILNQVEFFLEKRNFDFKQHLISTFRRGFTHGRRLTTILFLYDTIKNLFPEKPTPKH